MVEPVKTPGTGSQLKNNGAVPPLAVAVADPLQAEKHCTLVAVLVNTIAGGLIKLKVCVRIHALASVMLTV